jgi:signal transduction histidine kinase
MRRRSTASGKQRKSARPARAAAKHAGIKAPHPRAIAAAERSELKRLRRALHEAQERETATAEVLVSISGSTADTRPVFEALLANAIRLCGAKFGNIYRWEEPYLHLLAAHNTPSAFVEFRKEAFKPTGPLAQMVTEKAAVHVPDLAVEPGYAARQPRFVAAVELGRMRTLLVVPMLKDDQLIGAFTVCRDKVRPFTDKQIELVRNFATQAVIAVENARLLKELREQTEQLETRSREVIKLNQHLEQRVAEQVEKLHQVQAEFAHSARITMLGELAASIAHEVNHPLAAILTDSETGVRWLDRSNPNVAKALELLRRNLQDARRAADIIARIRAMVAGRSPLRAELSLHDVIEESIAFVRHELQSMGVVVSRDFAPAMPPVLGDRTQLQQVIVNLTMNAIQAMAQSATMSRKLLIRTDLPSPGTLFCSIEDSGPGIDPLHLGRLFESFFTTKNAGMGMGLSVSRSIIEAHGGELRADNGSILGGARFHFELLADSAFAR